MKTIVAAIVTLCLFATAAQACPPIGISSVQVQAVVPQVVYPQVAIQAVPVCSSVAVQAVYPQQVAVQAIYPQVAVQAVAVQKVRVRNVVPRFRSRTVIRQSSGGFLGLGVF